MSSITLYETTVGLYISALESLKVILQKAKEYAPEESTSYPSLRLYEDMLPFSFQIQTTSNIAKKALQRLVPEKGPFPVWEDNETTMDELIARVDKTLALLKTIKPEDLAGREANILEIKLGPNGGSATAEAKGYALGYALPNIFFHLTTAYAILRSKGVPLGKRTYLNSFFEPVVLSVEE